MRFILGRMTTDSYERVLTYVIGGGMPVAPRGLETLEIDPLTCNFRAGETVTRKGFNPALGIVEGLQIVGGFTDRKALKRVAPKTFSEGYFNHPNVEYGEMLAPHLPAAFKHLKADLHSRRVIIPLAAPGMAEEALPCAHTVQLRAVGDRLSVYVSMRSWDLLRGLPYNVTMWGLAAQIWAQALGVDEEDPWISIHATSPHIYLSDLEAGLQEEAGTGPRFGVSYVGFDEYQPGEWGPLIQEILNGVPWSLTGVDSWERRPFNIHLEK